MAFRNAKEWNEEKYAGKFILADDKDSADVIFLYKSYNDVLLADVHYVKSADYNGYVQCTGHGCPACEKKIRVQNKLFIPLFNLNTRTIQFWDRSTRFESQLNREVFKNYDCPVNYVFTITRNGKAQDINTTYTITPKGRNTSLSYEQILNMFQLKMPDAYEFICKDYNNDQLRSILNSTSNDNYDDLPDYSVTPRTTASAPSVELPDIEPIGTGGDSADFVNIGDDVPDDIDDVKF